MCICTNKVLIARKEKVVYKVLHKDGTTIFRSSSGLAYCGDIKAFGIPFDKMIQHKATGFDLGCGFTVFASEKSAKAYVDNLAYCILPKFLFKIVKYKIPIGTRYATGKIYYGYIGGGLNAIRCEKLKTWSK